MSMTHSLIAFGAFTCIVCAPAWAGHSFSVVKETAHVKFSSSVQELVHDGHISGVFTITCKPRTKNDLENSAWMMQCNRLGRLAIREAVKRGFINPVKGVPFVKASKLPDNAHLTGMSISRNVPLADRPGR